MPYIGNSQVAGVHQNNFKILDDISSYIETFVGSSSSIVDTTNNTITIPQHRFYHGQRVTYNNGGGSNIGGLTSGTVYYAVADSHSTIKLATSLANALINQVINLSSVGSGSNHTLKNSFDGVNKKFKLTHSGGNGVNLSNASHATIAINNVIQRPNLAGEFTEGFAIEGGKNIVFKTAPTSTDTFWGNTIAEAVGTFDSTDHAIDTFTADGTTTNFSLSKIPPSIRDIHITLDGVTQHTTSFSLQGNVLVFSTAPANGTAIQVKHMGFVGASISGVTGFYGRIGNVALQDSDILRGDGSLISGLSSGIPGISTTGTSHFNNLNISGVSTFSSNVNVTGIATFTNTLNYFGPKISGSTSDNAISMGYNGVLTQLNSTDTNVDFFVRSAGSLYLISEYKVNTTGFGDGYGYIVGSNGLEPSWDYKPFLGTSSRRFGTVFADQLNIAGVSTFSGNVNVTGIGTFASTFNYFGPKVSGTNEHGISLIYNSGTGLLTFHDQSGDGYIRSYSDLFFLVDADQSTGYIGGGYGLQMTAGFTGSPPGSLLPYTINHGLPNLGRTAARFGTLFSEQVNISGVSTFSGPVSIAATAHFNNQSLFFGPVLDNGEISIDIVDNGIAATFDHNDTSGLGLFIRTGSDLYLLADHKTSTNSNGDGYGLIIQSGSGNIIPSHDFRPQLGLSNREFGTIFADQLNISGISTVSSLNVNNIGNYDGLKIEEGNRNTSTSLNGSFNVYLSSGHVHTYTTATGGNYLPRLFYDGSTTINSLMSDGDVITFTLMVASSSHYITGLVIEGVTQTVQWVGGSAPSAANGSGYDIYAFTIISTGGTSFIVIGNQVSAA